MNEDQSRTEQSPSSPLSPISPLSPPSPPSPLPPQPSQPTQTSLQTTNTKKRKTPTSTNERSNKKRKNNPKFTEEETTVLLEAYRYHGGDWKKIIRDEKVKKLNRTEKNLKNRIEYLRKKKNESLKAQRGTQMRDSIVNELEDTQELFDDIEDAADNYERDNFFEDDSPVANGNDEQEELTEQQQLLHDAEAEQLNHTFDSNEIQTADDYRTAAATLKTRQQIRNERIRQKTCEHRAVINDIRDQRRERNEHNQTSQALMMMLLQQMKQDAKDKQEQKQMQNLIMSNVLETLKQNQLVTMMMMEKFGLAAPKQSSNNSESNSIMTETHNSDDHLNYDKP